MGRASQITLIEFYVIHERSGGGLKNDPELNFRPGRDAGLGGFDRPSIAMGTRDSYDVS